MIVIDTNLLVYAHREAVAEHVPAKQAIERASQNPSGWGMTLPTLNEFWSVVTHPKSLGRPSLPAEAAAFLRNLQDAGAMVLLPPADFAHKLLRRAAELELKGPRIFDLQILLIAHAWGAEQIWTHDAGFLRLPEMAVVDPLGA